jgi:hypothetical protein
MAYELEGCLGSLHCAGSISCKNRSYSIQIIDFLHLLCDRVDRSTATERYVIDPGRYREKIDPDAPERSVSIESRLYRKISVLDPDRNAIVLTSIGANNSSGSTCNLIVGQSYVLRMT